MRRLTVLATGVLLMLLAIAAGACSCAVIGGAGSYAGLHGHATVIGHANLNTATVTETIFLSSPC